MPFSGGAEGALPMNGICAYGAYIPYYRLERQAIAQALGVPPGRGTRAVASYDEDTTSMGVEAARLALAAAPDGMKVSGLAFATANPPYLDKTNANAIHAALGLDPSVAAFDLCGSVRSGVAALLFAGSGGDGTMAVLSDIRTGLPGGSDERDGGDGAAAFLFGSRDVIAEPLGGAATTAEFLERWRVPGESASRQWEERFGEHAYVPLANDAWAAALKSVDLAAEQIDHLIVAGVHPRAARQFLRAAGVRPEAIADDLSATVGNTGTAQPGILLADVLDRAQPNQVIALVVLADGANVLFLRTTEALAGFQPVATVASQVAAGSTALSYQTFITWRGVLRREPPRRPDPTAPAAPPSYRREDWKFGFNASRCEDCGTRHLPPARVCVQCGATDRMIPERLADVPATIATFTVDRLAFTLSPPLVAAVVDFDGGGRFRCEVTDVDPDAVAIGDRVEMTFRRISTVNGIHNYFWKARPIRGGS